MQFTYTQKRERSSAAQRSVAMGTGAMVASSHYLSSAAGYNALKKGGNAVDAAVAMVASLSVVEPHSVGIGGDAFALIYLAEEDRLIGMNASGRAPYAANLKWFHDQGIYAMPERGILAVTVPGALHGWSQAIERYGNLTLAEVFEDAFHLAEQGFPVTEVIAGEWRNSAQVLRDNPEAAATYLVEGQSPRPGRLFKNAALARTYKRIMQKGIGSFYGGEIGDAIVAYSKQHNGLLSRKDFQDHSTTWVEPLKSDYRGYSVVELPPNGQGITALQMLKILEGYDVSGLGHNTADYLHLIIEAKKMAFSDRDRFITDPEFEPAPLKEMLSCAYAAQCRARIRTGIAMAPPPSNLAPAGSDTVYVAAVDSHRNAVSFISSIYMHFGAGMVAGDTGIILQNRGHSFSLDPDHPNRIEAHKRPLHTIIPGMLFKNGRFLMTFGVMGGDMQPQGHAQLLMNLIDFKMNLQEAVDAPRVRHKGGKEVLLETGISLQTLEALEGKGHKILRPSPPINEWGGGQAIFVDAQQNVLLGASDRRKDGCALCY